MALGLPNGLVVLTADWRHRVLVLDRKTNRVVLQYGQTDRPGNGVGSSASRMGSLRMEGVLPFLLTLALAPLPSIEAGPVQKVFPAYPLPSLKLPLPGVRQAVYLSNGHITVAHVVMEVTPAPAERLLEMAQWGIRRVFEEKGT
ncbi:MAG: hypothetical protein ACUVUP_02555 [Thermaceae bacterium]